ncbi:hypothetical protein BK727_07560 [Bacillus thuringiensis serovar roskildiensis]|uniref:Uncharacterized protein n=1 Tax=Bacillus thuringiensis serovar sooncheon TaxID=180891 RepID=A0A9Q5X5T8_BACTU|nr:hypothetical protein [Bacillus thuringiensis]ARV91351.1 hypothetical protein BJG91_01450 [Bacillus thuringiensis]OTW70684.1 hypothetical protein BK707_11295 [Bacillus thuringiensis serovar coreanensis]OTX50995.1 hypothetical protein BK724_05325 [Bacillus thuringiensis serovar sooncheon]OTX56832.1 hypothetical protein BK725_08515 [Bacillus thuringiensis serovar guiyangiensis]OTX71429.1 hypothetical protein BK727_07560 [Bacillus thuringiensis serovar roskildiensis]
MKLKFIHVENGIVQRPIPNNLFAVSSTGDIIEDPGSGGEKFKVESVTHQNVFNSPGEHPITVNLMKL